MPYSWQDDSGGATLTARPYRSLPARGFVWLITATACGVALPLLATIGSPVLWGLLPFAALAVWGLWAAITRTNRTVTETLRLTHSGLLLTHDSPGRAPLTWHTNPYWVQVRLRAGPVEDYLTLAAAGREVELGRFLLPEERRSLARELRARLAGLRGDNASQ